MPGAQSSVVIKSKAWGAVAKKSRAAVSRGVRKVAFAIQDQAQANIVDIEAIDTGSMLNSGYVETQDETNRAEAVAKAQALAPEVVIAEPGAKPGDLEARVAFAVEHAIYVEMGVEGSAYGDFAARPFLTPAAEEYKGKAGKIVGDELAKELS